MQAVKKESQRHLWIWIGIGLGGCISFLAYLGIAGLLFLVESSKLPEEELAIFSSLFYGIVFFIALGGMRTESRRHKMLLTGKPYATSLPSPESEAKKKLGRIKTILWYVFSSISIGWLTPALVIYWADPRHPDWAVSISLYLLSLVAATVYALKRAEKILTGYNYILLYAGVCLGAIIVDRAFAALWR